MVPKAQPCPSAVAKSRMIEPSPWPTSSSFSLPLLRKRSALGSQSPSCLFLFLFYQARGWGNRGTKALVSFGIFVHISEWVCCARIHVRVFLCMCGLGRALNISWNGTQSPVALRMRGECVCLHVSVCVPETQLHSRAHSLPPSPSLSLPLCLFLSLKEARGSISLAPKASTSSIWPCGPGILTPSPSSS